MMTCNSLLENMNAWPAAEPGLGNAGGVVIVRVDMTAG
jgi:hypothetical protein